MITKILPGARSVLKYNNKMFGVLFLHGFMGNPSEFKYMIERCEEEKFSYFAPRYPGHGTTIEDMITTSGNDWYMCAREAYIEMSSHCSKVYIVGHSMGACFSVNIANEFNTEKVVLISMPHELKDFRLNFTGAISKFSKILQIESSSNGINEPEESKKHVGYHSGIPVSQSGDLLKIIKNTEKNLHKFHSEVLICQSEGDTTIPANSSEYIFSNIISIRKQKLNFQKSNHVIMLDYDRHELAERIFSFLKE